ncbi:hypothetical protein DL98DRAFT_512993, partial [Cadophora sp. DSE1049]
MNNPPQHLPVQILINSNRPSSFPYNSALIPNPNTLSELNNAIRTILSNNSFG